MNYSIAKKITDNLLVFMLVMSTGGMLFVLNRNIVSGSYDNSNIPGPSIYHPAATFEENSEMATV